MNIVVLHIRNMILGFLMYSMCLIEMRRSNCCRRFLSLGNRTMGCRSNPLRNNMLHRSRLKIVRLFLLMPIEPLLFLLLNFASIRLNLARIITNLLRFRFVLMRSCPRRLELRLCRRVCCMLMILLPSSFLVFGPLLILLRNFHSLLTCR